MKVIQSYSFPSSPQVHHGHQAYPPTGVAQILSGLAEIRMSGVKPEDSPRLLPPDNMAPALVIMADVRAYFQGMFFIHLFICTCQLIFKIMFCFSFENSQLRINILRITLGL
jgi:hypothetical protein